MAVTLKTAIAHFDLWLHYDFLCPLDSSGDVSVGVTAAAVEFALWHHVVDG